MYQHDSMARPATKWHNPSKRCGWIYLSATIPMMVGMKIDTIP